MPPCSLCQRDTLPLQWHRVPPRQFIHVSTVPLLAQIRLPSWHQLHSICAACGCCLRAPTEAPASASPGLPTISQARGGLSTKGGIGGHPPQVAVVGRIER